MPPRLVTGTALCGTKYSTAVTDASVSEVRIFTLLSLGGGRTNGRWSCHGERWLGSSCFTVGGSHSHIHSHPPLVVVSLLATSNMDEDCHYICCIAFVKISNGLCKNSKQILLPCFWKGLRTGHFGLVMKLAFECPYISLEVVIENECFHAAVECCTQYYLHTLTAHFAIPILILSRFGVCVSYRRGSGLDNWIYCTLYIHTYTHTHTQTNRDYRQYNAIAILLTFSSPLHTH
jgi:hypothetical protein